MAGRNYCQKNTTLCSAPSSRPSLTGETHERRAKRQRSEFFATLRCRFARRDCFAGAGGDRENECAARGGGAPGGVGLDRLRGHHTIRPTRFRANCRGEMLPGGEAMKRAGITPVALEAKEGLSLLNGTQGMLALLSLALHEADILVDSADVAASLSLDALRGSPGAFDARIMHARAYPGAATTARNLAHLNEGSQIRESHRAAEKDPRVQDAYSLRCTPQVHGAVRDALAQARETAAVELNSATDNPLVFVRDANSGDIISGGNFHGQPLAMAADQVAIAIATLGGIVERRIEQMTNPLTSMLPAFLTPEPGLNSGFMIAQVTAAALTSENKALATPHSVDSISTSGNQEDYVSMGMSGARRLAHMLVNLRNTIAIELLCACQGIDLLAPLQTGALAKKAYDVVRVKSAKVSEDRPLSVDIESVSTLAADGTFSALLR